MHPPRIQWALLGIGAAALAGCGELQGDADPTDDAVTSTNGISTVNGIATRNGISTVNGISTRNGLDVSGSGLMTTALGRTQLAYIVRCALPATASITKQ